MPWFRLRHHCRFFFRQFISSDMMIFQEDMVQRKGQRLQGLLPDSRLQFAFPDNDGMPSHFCQPMQHLMVPFPVPPDFILPELGIRFRHHIIPAPFMSMPEASVYKDDRTILAQYYIRMTRQTRVVESIAEPSAEKELPHHYLRLGIPPAYRSHTTMALLLGQFVCHYLRVSMKVKMHESYTWKSAVSAFFISSVSFTGMGAACWQLFCVMISLVFQLYCAHSGSVFSGSRRYTM